MTAGDPDGGDLESPPCPLCGGEALQPRVEAPDDWVPRGGEGRIYRVARCLSCGASCTTPRYREARRHLAYAGAYPFYARARQDAGGLGPEELARFEGRARRVCRAHPEPGRILDLGMGDGAFLAVMAQRGWEVHGLDLEPRVVAFARERLGLASCVAADVERDPLPAGPFDAVTLWGLLQLAYRPREVLEKAAGVLVPGGLLGIGVSNIGGLGFRLFGRHWRGLGLPRHLVHFDAPALTRLVQSAGFEVLEVAFATPPWIAGPSVEAALGLGPSGRVLRRGAEMLLGALGRTPLGDTMTLLARRPA